MDKPTDKHSWDFDPYYVAHLPSMVLIRRRNSKAMGGSGGIVELGGILSNTPAIERKAGLEKTIAATRSFSNFKPPIGKPSEAYTVVGAWPTRFGSKIKGIWAANDDMAIGALEVLRSEKLAGKIPITGIDGIKAGLMPSASCSLLPRCRGILFWQGGMGLAIAYDAKTVNSIRRKNGTCIENFMGSPPS